jgi:hypothetical protein
MLVPNTIDFSVEGSGTVEQNLRAKHGITRALRQQGVVFKAFTRVISADAAGASAAAVAFVMAPCAANRGGRHPCASGEPDQQGAAGRGMR